MQMMMDIGVAQNGTVENKREDICVLRRTLGFTETGRESVGII